MQYTPQQVLEVFAHIKQELINITNQKNEFELINWHVNNSCLLDLVGPSSFQLKELKNRVIKNSLISINRHERTRKKFNEKNLINITGKALELLQSLQENYLTFIKAEYKYQMKLYNLEKIPTYDFWDEVKEIARDKIFIGLGGIPLWLSYLNKNYSWGDTSLVEFHLGGDPYKPFRKGNYDFDNLPVSLYGKTLEEIDKDCLIIDQAYSGHTLKQLKNIFGPNSKILSFYPKSWEAIQLSDYFVFNNVLFNKEELSLKQEDWYEELLELSIGIEDLKKITYK